MAKLTAKQLKALPDSMFGLPKTRQYPMPDKAHVIKAIQFFKYCKDADKPELAKNINRRAKELKMKIKVQPSSAFYKYASKEILKEALLVQEFHIGQLAPIVTLEPQIIKMNFGNNHMEPNDGPLERLKRLWGSQKTLHEKETGTSDIIQEAVDKGHQFDSSMLATLNAINDMNYMLRNWRYSNDDTTFADRLFDRKEQFYIAIQDSIRNHDMESIIQQLNALDNGTQYACALAILSYTSELSRTEKEFIMNRVDKLRSNGLEIPLFAVSSPDKELNWHETTGMTKTDKSCIINMSDEDIFHIDQFVNLLPGIHQLDKITWKLAVAKHGENPWSNGHVCFADCHEDNTVQTQMLLTKFVEDESKMNGAYGYYRRMLDDGRYADFIKINGKLYVAVILYPKNRCIIFLTCIYDPSNEEYNSNISAFSTGANIPIKVITRSISMPHKLVSLEASDFKDVYNGIQISKNGNVSFILDELQPWQDKFNLCKQTMDRNLKDNEYEQYKNNQCALYSLINVIYNRFNPTLADDSQEAKSALGVMNKAIMYFRDSINNISKIQPEYNFINYYMSQHYNDKLSVFKSTETDDVRDEALLSYNWIMNG